MVDAMVAMLQVCMRWYAVSCCPQWGHKPSVMYPHLAKVDRVGYLSNMYASNAFFPCLESDRLVPVESST